MGLSSTTVTYLAHKETEIGKKSKIRSIMLFKVIKIDINRKPYVTSY